MSGLAVVDQMAADSPKSFERAYKIMTGFNIGGAVRKGNTDLLRAIHDGLEVMQAEGKQKAIFTKHKIDPEMGVPAAVKTE